MRGLLGVMLVTTVLGLALGKKPKDSPPPLPGSLEELKLRIERLPLSRDEKNRVLEAIETREGLLIEASAALVEGFDQELANVLREMGRVRASEVSFEEVERGKVKAQTETLVQAFNPPFAVPVVKSLLITVRRGIATELESLADAMFRPDGLDNNSKLSADMAEGMNKFADTRNSGLKLGLQHFMEGLPYRDKDAYIQSLDGESIIIREFASQLEDGARNSKKLSDLLRRLAQLSPEGGAA